MGQLEGGRDASDTILVIYCDVAVAAVVVANAMVILWSRMNGGGGFWNE